MTAHLVRPLARVVGILASGGLVVGLAACDNGGGGTETGGGATPVASSTAPTAGTSASAASANQVSGRRADLELTDETVRTLARAGIDVRATAPARRSGGDELRLPVTGGTVSYRPLAGSVTTSGGGVASRGDARVRVSAVTFDLERKVVTGTVDGKRSTLATLDTAGHELEHSEGPVADIDGIDVTFTPATVRALNGRLGTDLPTSGLTAELELHLSR